MNGEMIIVFSIFAILIGLSFYGFVASINRSAQLRQIALLEQNVITFIREFHFTEIDEVTNEVVHCISYQPHYKRPVCGTGRNVEFVDESCMHDFPRGVDWRDLEQVNTLLVFWKREHDAKAKKEFIDHPMRTFGSEEEKKLYWEQVRGRQAERDLSIF
jgi:hypothetical protein